MATDISEAGLEKIIWFGEDNIRLSGRCEWLRARQGCRVQ